MKITENFCDLIGSTPLFELKNIEAEEKLASKIVAKVEFFNPAGSAKDRVAKSMIENAEKSGILKKGATIIEPTSGNTGVGLAAVAAGKGYNVILTMPETMSVERRNLLKAFGAKLILTEKAKGMAGAVEKAEELSKEIPGSFLAGQFVNPANPLAHYTTTGPEIWEDTDGKVDIFVAGIGTGGTVSGTGKYLKEKNPKIKIVGVEPFSSPLLSKGVSGPHDLQGIGANFIPKTLERGILDEVITIKDEEAYDFGKRLARHEGLLVGITSGAAVCAAVKLAKREENKGKIIVALLPDTGERYLSTKMFEE